MVAPFTYAPAGLDKNKAVPATSSGRPIRRNGIPATTTSPAVANVCAITDKQKGASVTCEGQQR